MWCAFTSRDGRMAGVVRCERERGLPEYGVAMAVLERPCSLVEWQTLLLDASDPYEAVGTLVSRNGGLPVFQIIPVPDPYWVVTRTVGEA